MHWRRDSIEGCVCWSDKGKRIKRRHRCSYSTGVTIVMLLNKAGATNGTTGAAGRAIVIPARAPGGAAEDPVEALAATIVFKGGWKEGTGAGLKARGEQ